MSPKRQALLIALAITLAVSGVVLLVIAFKQPHSHLVLWYFKDGSVYQRDLADQSESQFNLPSKPQYAPVLSQDGQFLAYADKSALHLMKTSNGQTLLSVPHLETSRVTNLTDTQYSPYIWSPDAQWLLLRLYRYEQEGLGLLHVSDGKIVEIKNGTGHRYTCGDTGEAWSSDSSRLTITQMESEFCEWGESRAGVYETSVSSLHASALYSYTFEGRDPFINKMIKMIKVTGAAAAPARQPSSDLIAFIQETDRQINGHFITSTIQLDLIKTDGTTARALIANSTGQIFSPVWSVDGLRLFYESYDVEGVANGVYSIKADGTDAKLVIARKGIAPLAFSPDGKYLVTQEHSLNSYPSTIFPAWKDGFQIIDIEAGHEIRIPKGDYLGWQVVSD